MRSRHQQHLLKHPSNRKGSLPYALQLVLLALIAVILGKGKSFLKSPLGHMSTTEPIINTDSQTPEAGPVNHDGPSGAGRGSYSSSPGNTEDEHRNDLGSAVTKEKAEGLVEESTPVWGN